MSKNIHIELLDNGCVVDAGFLNKNVYETLPDALIFIATKLIQWAEDTYDKADVIEIFNDVLKRIKEK